MANVLEVLQEHKRTVQNELQNIERAISFLNGKSIVEKVKPTTGPVAGSYKHSAATRARIGRTIRRKARERRKAMKAAQKGRNTTHDKKAGA